MGGSSTSRARRLLVAAAVAACAACAACGDNRAPAIYGGAADAADPADAAATGPRVLFVGNSYVYAHDVPGRLRALVGAVRVEQSAPGGYRLAQHAIDARTDGTALAGWLRTGAADANRFDAVILQEQSQVGGYPLGNGWLPDRLASLDGAAALGELAAGRGATVILYATWGRALGDPDEPTIFGSYRAMQDHLDTSYLHMAEHLRARGVATRIAPVGAGFHRVYDDVVAAGADPLADGSAFRALYDPDGSHPSPSGAYLAACVLGATVTGADPRGFADDAVLGVATSARLRAACAAAVAEPRWAGPPQAVELAIPYAAPRGDAATWSRYDVAASADATRLLIAPSRGEARVLRRTGDAWAVEAVLPLPAGFVSLALALSADGTVALLGDPATGTVRGFRRAGGAWQPDGVVTIAATAGFGRSIAVAADGARALIASDAAVHELTYTDWAWTPGPELPVAAARVALDAAATRAIVTGAGAPAVWRRSPDGWSLEAALGTAGAAEVAIDAAGARAAALTLAGSVATPTVYVRTDGGWALEATLGAVGGVSPSPLATLALAADGARLIVGAPGRPAPLGAGAAWSFARGAGGWHAEALVVLATRLDDVQARGFGVACALAAEQAFCTEAGWTGVPRKPGAVRAFGFR